jgi:hypothetical protein
LPPPELNDFEPLPPLDRLLLLPKLEPELRDEPLELREEPLLKLCPPPELKLWLLELCEE